MSRHRKPLILICVLLCLTACSSLIESLEPPSVKISALRLDDLSLTQQSFALTFAVENPNPFPIPVKAVEYGVGLAGESFASGSTEDAFTIPASGDTEFSLTVNTNLVQTAQALSQLLLRSSATNIDYDLKGNFQVNLPFVDAIPFDHKGEVKLQR
ncbi:MAG: LEA type 2 family protein [Pseudomonadota bacterium]